MQESVIRAGPSTEERGKGRREEGKKARRQEGKEGKEERKEGRKTHLLSLYLIMNSFKHPCAFLHKRDYMLKFGALS